MLEMKILDMTASRLTHVSALGPPGWPPEVVRSKRLAPPARDNFHLFTHKWNNFPIPRTFAIFPSLVLHIASRAQVSFLSC